MWAELLLPEAVSQDSAHTSLSASGALLGISGITSHRIFGFYVHIPLFIMTLFILG